MYYCYIEKGYDRTERVLKGCYADVRATCFVYNTNKPCCTYRGPTDLRDRVTAGWKPRFLNGTVYGLRQYQSFSVWYNIVLCGFFVKFYGSIMVGRYGFV